MTCPRCSREIDADSAFCRHCGARVGGPPPLPQQRLVRYPEQGRIAGVCAGLAAYFNADPTLVRLAWVILSIVPGAVIGGVVAYLIAWIVLPVDTAAEPGFGGRRLLRSVSNRKIAGVCGGLAEYLGVDATVVRLAWVVLSIYPGAVVCGILAYLVAWIIIPTAPGATLEPAPSAL